MCRLLDNVTIRDQQNSRCDQEVVTVPPGRYSHGGLAREHPSRSPPGGLESGRGVTLAMGMQWQMGSTPLDFNDFGLRAAYRPRHAASKRHQPSRAGGPPRASVAEEAGVDAARTQDYAHHQAAAGGQSYRFSPVPIRQMLLDPASNLVRLHPRRHDTSESRA